MNERLLKGGQMLGDLWFSCWQQAKEDTFLIRQLKERKGGREKHNSIGRPPPISHGAGRFRY